LDMPIVVKISQDNMEAVVEVERHDDSLIDADAIRRALDASGVKAGIDEEACGELAEMINRIPIRTSISHVVARGVSPVDGEDGRMELAVKYKLAPVGVADEHGSIDFHLRYPFTPIAAGQLIARIIPPTSGTAGMNVLGATIVAEPGKRATVSRGQGTRFEAAGLELRATRAGDLRCDGELIEVLDVIRVPGNLDYGAGSIDCAGGVRVEGDVLPGFHIHAGGDVWIAGVVDSAEVRSGGSVTVGQGILRGSLISATKSITTGYVREAYLESEGNVNIMVEAVNSTVVSGDTIVLRKGAKVVGGRLVARNRIEGGIAGHVNAVPTTLVAGVDALMELRAAKLASTIKRAEALQARVARIKHLAEPDRQAALSQLHSRFDIKREQHAKELAQLTQKELALAASRIQLHQIHPGVRIRIGPGEISIEQEHPHGAAFHYDIGSGHVVQS
jgi:uncharacterized protein (DUF342 family)